MDGHPHSFVEEVVGSEPNLEDSKIVLDTLFQVVEKGYSLSPG